MKKQKTSTIKNFFKAFKIIYKHEKMYVILRIINTIIEPIRMYVYALILNNAIAVLEEGNPTFEKLVVNVGGIVLINLILSLITRNLYDIISPYAEKLNYKIMLERSLKTLELDYELLEQPEGQEALEKASRYSGEYRGIIGLVNRGLFTIEYLLTALIGSVIILTVNYWLIVLVVILAIVKLVLQNKRQSNSKKIRDEAIPYWRKVNYVNNISTNLSIGKDLRVYNMDKFVQQERESVFAKIMTNTKQRVVDGAKYDVIIQFLSLIDTLALYGFMIYEVLFNNMQISTFSFMIASIQTLVNSIGWLASEYSSMYGCSLETEDHLAILGDKYLNKNQTEYLDNDEFSLEFKNVYYQYFAQEGYALENVSFKIKKGEKIALVGYNGAGKTTLTKLICGLYHPTKGEILLNGKNIETLTRSEIAKIISPVFQETLIYALDVETNITMEYQNEDKEKIKKISQLIGIDEKVNTLKDGYKTMLTRDLEDDGIELSGGESQKLCIARAAFKNSDLYILDEPTSAMDPLAEANLYKNLNNIISGNAVIYISHRLSSTKFCDKIIVLDEGKIKEIGTHQHLMNQDGLYKKLFSMQAEYYKGDLEYEEA